jgi:hypothetical protein
MGVRGEGKRLQQENGKAVAAVKIGAGHGVSASAA